MQKVKHNKIRNTGLLYEFLLRQITSEVLNNDKVSKTVQIIKQRFHENTGSADGGDVSKVVQNVFSKGNTSNKISE